MYFDNCANLDDLKHRYKQLVMQYHPDLSGTDTTATMQEINAEYARYFERLKAAQNAKAKYEHYNDTPKDQRTAYETTETAEEYLQIINALLTLKGLEIELCGSWLWIGGDTRTHKDTLKRLGMQWSRSKHKWYWHHTEPWSKKRRYRGNVSMTDIRKKYGSQTFTRKEDQLAV